MKCVKMLAGGVLIRCTNWSAAMLVREGKAVYARKEEWRKAGEDRIRKVGQET